MFRRAASRKRELTGLCFCSVPDDAPESPKRYSVVANAVSAITSCLFPFIHSVLVGVGIQIIRWGETDYSHSATDYCKFEDPHNVSAVSMIEKYSLHH
jgi:hypothetical protein